MIHRNHKPTPLVLTQKQKESIRTKADNPSKGLGDVVESFAKPIARAIDRVAGTNIQNCGGCQKRKEWLNQHFSNTPTANHVKKES